MTAAELILDDLLRELDRLTVIKLAARYIRERERTVKGRWAAERILRAAEDDAWRENDDD